mgnify:CR=1 FL=1
MRDQLPAWVDVRQLAPGMHFTGSFPVAAMSRWPDPEAPGSVRLAVDVVQAPSGRMGLEVELEADSVTRCQRCMQEMELRVATRLALEVVADETEAQRISDEVDVYVAQDGRVDWRALACDEALLAWPMMPRHPAGTCDPPGDATIE